MKNKIHVLLYTILCILISIFHLNLKNTYGKKTHTIVVVGDKSYPPFEFLDVNNNPKGIFIDIWNLWSRKTGIKAKYKLMEWSKAIEMVKTGKAHVIGGIFYSKERAKMFNFVGPYMKIDTRIFFSRVKSQTSCKKGSQPYKLTNLF